MRSMTIRRGARLIGLGGVLAMLLGTAAVVAGEPDSKMYWDVKDLRPGMKGVGKTVMVGTKLEEFGSLMKRPLPHTSRSPPSICETASIRRG